jgi:hypothetical protein
MSVYLPSAGGLLGLGFCSRMLKQIFYGQKTFCDMVLTAYLLTLHTDKCYFRSETVQNMLRVCHTENALVAALL